MKTPTHITVEDMHTFARRQHELYRRVTEGAVPIDQALANLQNAIEGKVATKYVETLSDMIALSGVTDVDTRIATCTFPVRVHRFDARGTCASYYGLGRLEEIGQRLKQVGLQFASAERLVAYAITNPHDQTSPVSALGSFGTDEEGRRYFLSLRMSGGRRQFRLVRLQIETHSLPLHGEWFHLVEPIVTVS